MKAKIILSAAVLVFAVPCVMALPTVEEASSSWSSSQSMPPAESDAATNNTSSSASNFMVSQDPSLDMAQRMSIVEQSLRNINQMDFPGQIEHLEQEIQLLRGTVDELEHKLKILQVQQKQGAQELNKNVQAVKGSSVASAEDSAEDNIALEAEAEPSSNAVVVNPNLTAEEQEKNTYDAAFSLVRAHAYDDAISAFQGYQKIFGGQGKYAANSYYWLGELYAHQQQYDKAQAALLTVVNNYPASNKAADGMLKLGIIEQRQGNQEKANAWLEKVIKNYPDSSSAKLAKNYLH